EDHLADVEPVAQEIGERPLVKMVRPSERLAELGGRWCIPQSRDREIVANHQGGEHQGGVTGEVGCLHNRKRTSEPPRLRRGHRGSNRTETSSTTTWTAVGFWPSAQEIEDATTGVRRKTCGSGGRAKNSQREDIMTRGHHLLLESVLASSMLITICPLLAADVTPDRLVNADKEPQNWLMNHRTYD